MTDHWYYRYRRGSLGPIPRPSCGSSCKRAASPWATMVRAGKDGDWIPALQVKGLFGPVSSATSPKAPPAPPPLPPRSTNSGSKTSAPIDQLAPPRVPTYPRVRNAHRNVSWFGNPSDDYLLVLNGRTTEEGDRSAFGVGGRSARDERVPQPHVEQAPFVLQPQAERLRLFRKLRSNRCRRERVPSLNRIRLRNDRSNRLLNASPPSLLLKAGLGVARVLWSSRIFS